MEKLNKPVSSNEISLSDREVSSGSGIASDTSAQLLTPLYIDERDLVPSTEHSAEEEEDGTVVAAASKSQTNRTSTGAELQEEFAEIIKILDSVNTDDEGSISEFTKSTVFDNNAEVSGSGDSATGQRNGQDNRPLKSTTSETSDSNGTGKVSRVTDFPVFEETSIVQSTSQSTEVSPPVEEKSGSSACDETSATVVEDAGDEVRSSIAAENHEEMTTPPDGTKVESNTKGTDQEDGENTPETNINPEVRQITTETTHGHDTDNVAADDTQHVTASLGRSAIVVDNVGVDSEEEETSESTHSIGGRTLIVESRERLDSGSNAEEDKNEVNVSSDNKQGSVADDTMPSSADVANTGEEAANSSHDQADDVGSGRVSDDDWNPDPDDNDDWLDDFPSDGETNDTKEQATIPTSPGYNASSTVLTTPRNAPTQRQEFNIFEVNADHDNRIVVFREWAKMHGTNSRTIEVLLVKDVLKPNVLRTMTNEDIEAFNIYPSGQLRVAQFLVREMKQQLESSSLSPERRPMIGRFTSTRQISETPRSRYGNRTSTVIRRGRVTSVPISSGSDTDESIEDEDQGHDADAADIDEGGALSDSEFIDAERILDISGEQIDGNLEHFYDESYDSKFDLPRKKSLVFDEERFEDIFLKCLICREVFNDDDKLPKMLACHHTFCLDCLRQMFRVEGEFRQNLTSAFRSMPIAVKIQCPTCRDGFIISEAEILRLPNDHTILELLIFVKTTGKSEVQYCSKHQLQPLNFFCEACVIPVCSDCTVLDHKEKDGHTVLNLEDALEKHTPVLTTTMDDLERERDKLTVKSTSLKKAQENIETIQSGLADQITTTFGRLREALFEREQELLDMCARDIDKKRDKIADNIKKVNDRDESLKQASEYLHKAMHDKDIKEMFSFNQGIKEKLATPFEVSNDIPDDFSVTFHFNSRQEASIKTQITNLGDVTFEHS